MAAELFRRGLRDHGRALLGWCAGAAAYLLFLSAIYPSIGGSADIEEVIQNLPDAVKGFFGLGAVDLTSDSGFRTELFSIVLPLLAIALGIGSGPASSRGRRSRAASSCSSPIPVVDGAPRWRRAPRSASSFSCWRSSCSWRWPRRASSSGSTCPSGTSSAVSRASGCSAFCTAGSRSRSAPRCQPRARDRRGRRVRRGRLGDMTLEPGRGGR
jgi:hypothetical protein